jgi:hypothetical protein
MPWLYGAVADADSVQSYLEDSLNIPKSRIRNLRDSKATRAGIISELTALETNPSIKSGDPILIYFAGHGGEAIVPVSWGAGGADSMIQTLVPQDYLCKINGEEVCGIPDRTINLLITRLSRAKGNNIVRPIQVYYTTSTAE